MRKGGLAFFSFFFFSFFLVCVFLYRGAFGKNWRRRKR